MIVRESVFLERLAKKVRPSLNMDRHVFLPHLGDESYGWRRGRRRLSSATAQRKC